MTVQDLIAKHEGDKTTAYPDTAGHPTIGIGHNLDTSPLPALNPPLTDDQSNQLNQPGLAAIVKANPYTLPNPALTEDQVSQIFQNDLASVMNDMSNLAWFSGLDPVRQAVLIDMDFNMGWNVLSQFTTFLGLVSSGNYTGAASDMMTTKWAKEVKGRAVEDSNMMSSGLWPDDPNFPQ